jgi:uncharacterized RDD family membrane protein YckC
LIEATHSVAEKPVQLARLGDRALAAFLDALALFPFIWLLGYGVAWMLGALHDGAYDLHGGPALLIILLNGLLWLSYYIVGEAVFSGTFGKQMMGIVVMSSLKTPLTPGQALVRNLVRPVDAIGLYLLGFFVALASKTNQRIGDKAAGTIVFEGKTRRGISLLCWIAWIAVGFTSCAIVLHLASS